MFHPLNLIIPLMILLPNFVFFKLGPQNMPNEHKKNTILTAAENIGRFGVFIVPLFSPLHIRTSFEISSLILLLLSLLLYYAGWARYFRDDREYRLLFAPMLGVPVPLAISPVVYFLSSSAVMHSPYLLILSAIFAFGHIPNSLSEYHRSIK